MAKVPVSVTGKLKVKGAGRCAFTGGEASVIEVRIVISAMWADRTVLPQDMNPHIGHSNPAKMVPRVVTLPKGGVVLATTITMIKPGTTAGGQASPGTRHSPAGALGRMSTDFHVNLAGIVTGS